MKLQYFFLGLGILLVGCMPIRIGYVDIPDENIQANFKTYRVTEIDIENETALEPQKANLERLVKAINREMENRGYTKERNSDLFINIGIHVTHEVQTRETDLRDAPMYIGQRNYHWESEEVVVSQYEEGTVVVHVVDHNNNKLIWEGAAIGTLAKSETKMEKRINAAMERLFTKFPFKAN